MRLRALDAVPGPFEFDPTATALLVIDMQCDFLLPSGFGASLGNDVTLLAAVGGAAAAEGPGGQPGGRHARRAHPGGPPSRPLGLPAGQAAAGHPPPRRIGDPGPYGRILVRGEAGHEIVEELAPRPDEPVLDKPGKGAFYATGLRELLGGKGITSLVVTGVTTEVCVHTTVREANDRGYECLVLADCTGSYFPEFHRVGLAMIAAQDGIFGWVAPSSTFLAALGASDAPTQPDRRPRP